MMVNLVILATMLFMHIVDDFYLQGILAKFKTREYWDNYVKEHGESSRKFRFDWIVSLELHAYSWTFMISLPMVINDLITRHNPHKPAVVIIVMILNWCIHIFVDNAKCNRHAISLHTDQTIHIVQVLVTYAIYLIVHSAK